MDGFFYSGQIRRFLSQFIRLISNFYIKVGKIEDLSSYLKVPVYYGDSSRQVAAIIAKNSESNLPTVPAMTIYIKSLRYDRPRVQNPTHVSKLVVRQRAYDPDTGQYTDKQGDIVTVERLMPVPYLLSLNLDIWTSNTEQKLQLLEQIAVLFNPSLEIQNTDNYLDWTSLSAITLTDVVYSSKSVPVGPEDQIDVATLSFDLPIWLSAPAKVKRNGIIEKIIASIYVETDIENLLDITLSNKSSDAAIIYTPIDLNVVYVGNTLKLFKLKDQTEFTDESESNYTAGNWKLAIQSFGELARRDGRDLLKNGLSKITLTNGGTTVVGTVSYHPQDQSLLLFNADIDTLPSNTLSPISAIVDPNNLKITTMISDPAMGTRLLILNSIANAPVWDRLGYPTLVASANSIIEFTGSHWLVKFDSAAAEYKNVTHYVTNLTTGIQYRWQNQQWQKSVEGRYGVGSWSFVPN